MSNYRGIILTIKQFLVQKLALLLIYLFNTLPIKKNKIFLFSYYGSQYGCNPKYITEYILNNCPEETFDIVWAFNDTESKKGLPGIRKVKTMSFRYFYELCTSKIIITNFRTTDLFIKRKKQYYIQTWHSSLRLKHIEKDAENVLPKQYVEMAKKDSLKCDLLLSGCEYSTNIFKRSFWYQGEILKSGTPRNDVLFDHNGQSRSKVLTKLKIPAGNKVILYAPTFRKENRMDVYDLKYNQMLERLRDSFGGNWIFLVKLHPHLILKSDQLIYGENVLDVTSYDDIQELLSISDILISDYSSLIFDFALTKRPCFLYLPDLNDYINNERQLYFDVMDLPFIKAYSNEDLLDQLVKYDDKNYQNSLDEFLNSVGSYETGKSCESLLNKISEVCFEKRGSEVFETV